jgi:hypothetical protein
MELQPTVDYSDVRQTRRLQVSWMSIYGRDLTAALIYERTRKYAGKRVNKAEIARLINGDIVHLEESILGNGLRYVSIHREDGSEVFDVHEYAGIRTRDLDNLFPQVRMARAIENADLGDGFKLVFVDSGSSANNGSTVTDAAKEFAKGIKKIRVSYTIVPRTEHREGYLSFHYTVKTHGEFTYMMKNFNEGGIEEPAKGFADVKVVEARIRTDPNYKPGRRNPFCLSSLGVAYNLPELPHFNRLDQVIFNFGTDGMLQGVSCLSQSSKKNPEWKDSEILRAIGKGQNKQIEHLPKTAESAILSKAVFGKDVRNLRHYARETLDSLMKAAINEEDIELEKVFRFRWY